MNKKTFERRALIYFGGVFLGIALAVFLLKGRNARIPNFTEAPETVFPRVSFKTGGRMSFTLSPNLQKAMLPNSSNFLVLGKKESEAHWKIQGKLDLPLPNGAAPFFKEFSSAGDYEVRGIFSLCPEIKEDVTPVGCKRARIVYPITVSDSEPREQLDIYVDM